MTRWMIKAKGLVDVERMSVVDNPYIVVSEGMIEAVGAQADMPPVQAGTEVMDLGDRYLLPGLINFHAHACLPGDGTPLAEAFNRPYEMTIFKAAHNLKMELHSGVTSMRDCGGLPALLHGLIRGMDEGLIEGPRLYHCGEVVTTTGGHCNNFGMEADGPVEVVKAVRKQFKNGASFVKLMATGGGSPRTFPAFASFSVEEIRAAVEAAHRIDKKVTVHARGIPGIRNALDAGVDFIEHACFELPDGSQKFDERLAGEMAASGTFVIPTIRLYRDVREHLNQVKEEQGLTAEEEGRLALLDSNISEKLKALAGMRSAGVTILAGNDAGIPQTGFGMLWKELAIMTEGGMSPMEAIMAATLTPAKVLNLDREIGSIRAGKRADIIAVPGDPTRNINHLGQVSFVMKGGQVYRK